MTTEEYKKLHPEHEHLQGDALWNAMENYLISHDQHLKIEYKDAEGRDRMRFPWIPENIGERVGTWDVIKHEVLYSEQEFPFKPDTYTYMVFDVSEDKPKEE